MKIKKHETPEFQIIRQNEANAKFFVASFDGEPNGSNNGMNTLTVTNVNSGATGNSNGGWF